ncbi:energy-coupling factor transporter transmembrane component T family protein [Nesterenkonia populi]
MSAPAPGAPEEGPRRRSRPIRPRDQVFGQRAPGHGFLHRTPAGTKVAALAGIAVVVMVLRSPAVSAGVMAAVILLAATARVPLGMLLVLLRRVWLLVAAVLVAQLIFNDAATAVEVITRVLAGVLAAQLMILTTTVPELLRVFSALLRPLRLVGIGPGRIVLAAMIMLRAIPYLADQFRAAEQQARARGLERDLRARTVPVLLAAVAYARDTGRALSARGIDEVS